MILVYFFPLEARMWTVTGIVLLMFLSSNFMLVFKKIFIARYLLYNIVPYINMHQLQVYISSCFLNEGHCRSWVAVGGGRQEGVHILNQRD